MEGLAADNARPSARAYRCGSRGFHHFDAGSLLAVYYVGIRNKQDTLKLLRYTFGEKLGSERSEGETTFVKVSLGGSQNSTGVAQWNFIISP